MNLSDNPVDSEIIRKLQESPGLLGVYLEHLGRIGGAQSDSESLDFFRSLVTSTENNQLEPRPTGGAFFSIVTA